MDLEKFNATTDAVSMTRKVNADARELGAMPALDLVVVAMARAGFIKLHIGQAAPVTDVENTVWIKPPTNPTLEESNTFLWDGTAFVAATPALYRQRVSTVMATAAAAIAGVETDTVMSPATTKLAIESIGGAIFASSAQGALADSAVQPGDLATIAISGDFADLVNVPALATGAQGALADSAVQPGDLATVATTGQYGDLAGVPLLGNSALRNVGSTAGTVAAGDDPRFSSAVASVEIGGTDDLDNYENPGFYVQSSDAGAAGGTNYPQANAGSLRVLANSTKSEVWQMYHVYGVHNVVYVRTRYNGTWCAWKMLASAGDLAAVASTGAYGDLSGRPSLGNSASRNVGTAAGTVAAGDDARFAPFNGVELAGGVDLNTVTTPGVYTQTSNSEAGNGSNYPVAHAGVLTVHSAGGGSMVWQEYHTYGTYNRVYVRGYYSAWSAWEELIKSSEAGIPAPTAGDTPIATLVVGRAVRFTGNFGSWSGVDEIGSRGAQPSQEIAAFRSFDCTVVKGGNIRVVTQFRRLNANSGTTYVRVLKNGVEAGASTVTTTSWTTRSFDISVSDGDRIAVQFRSESTEGEVRLVQIRSGVATPAVI